MSRIRTAWALCALGFFAATGHAQTAPAVSSVVAFYLSTPVGNLVKGPDGALYGAGSSASSVSAGIVYRATTDGSSVTTLYQFSGTEASAPGSGLLLASDGYFYGVTKFGPNTDTTGAGTIYKIKPDGTGFQIIYRLDAVTGQNQDLNAINTNGAYPEAELVEGADGYLYGTARAGGSNGTGTIFKVSKDGTGFKLLRKFGAVTSSSTSGLTVTVDGAAPVAPLVIGSDGMFYGTTSLGGANGRGTIFRIAFDGTGFQVLKEFSATTADATTGLLKNADGASPLAGLTDGGDGFFYGVTAQGGTSGNGVIYALPADGSSYTVLYNFDGATGSRPAAELMVGASGKLYGTAAAGGVNSSGTATTYGTIFSIDRAGTNFARLYTFDASKGALPASRLLELTSGVLFGTTTSSGNCGYGTLYRYSAAGDEVTGNTKCGQKKNNSGGGGAAGWGILLLLGGLGFARRRLH